MRKTSSFIVIITWYELLELALVVKYIVDILVAIYMFDAFFTIYVRVPHKLR